LLARGVDRGCCVYSCHRFTPLVKLLLQRFHFGLEVGEVARQPCYKFS
jgi:hypothetical protein